jgi:hypothetical protein
MSADAQEVLVHQTASEASRAVSVRDGIEHPGRAVVADSYAADRLRAAQADPAEQSGDSCENRIVVGLGNVLMPTVSAESRF